MHETTIPHPLKVIKALISVHPNVIDYKGFGFGLFFSLHCYFYNDYDVQFNKALILMLIETNPTAANNATEMRFLFFTGNVTINKLPKKF